MNWHATLIALTIIVGIAMFISAMFTALSEQWGLFVRLAIPLIIAFVLLIGVVVP